MPRYKKYDHCLLQSFCLHSHLKQRIYFVFTESRHPYNASCFTYSMNFTHGSNFGQDVKVCLSKEHKSTVVWEWQSIKDLQWSHFENSKDIKIETNPKHCLTIKNFPKQKYRKIRFQFHPCYIDINVQKCLTGRDPILLLRQ